jgi:hypothetical protein
MRRGYNRLATAGILSSSASFHFETGQQVPNRRATRERGDVDHRAIKRRCASMLGFKSFGNAAITQHAASAPEPSKSVLLISSTA